MYLYNSGDTIKILGAILNESITIRNAIQEMQQNIKQQATLFVQIVFCLHNISLCVPTK